MKLSTAIYSKDKLLSGYASSAAKTGILSHAYRLKTQHSLLCIRLLLSTHLNLTYGEFRASIQADAKLRRPPYMR